MIYGENIVHKGISGRLGKMIRNKINNWLLSNRSVLRRISQAESSARNFLRGIYSEDKIVWG